MWKIAIASMLLATSAFGAVSLNWGVDKVVPQAGVAQLTLSMDIGAGDQVNGFNGVLSGDKDVKVTRATPLPASNFFTGVLVVDTVSDKAVGPAAKVDLGGINADGFAAAPSGSMKLCDLTVKLDPAVQLPITLTITGAYNTPLNPDTFEFQTIQLPATSVTIVPEPASMMLLAAGAAFFARRRRA